MEGLWRSTVKRKALKPSERTLTKEKHAYLYQVGGGGEIVLIVHSLSIMHEQVQETNDKTSPLSTAFSNACVLYVHSHHRNTTKTISLSTVEAFKWYLKEEVC